MCKEKNMKKIVSFVFVWLILTVLGGGELLFAGNLFGQRGAQQAGGGITVADLPEVEERKDPPRPNPKTGQASGNVYALRAEPLKPAQESLPPPVHAIAGVKGEKMVESGKSATVVDIIVNLPESEKFSKGILEGEDVSDWIENLPEGLEAKAHGIKKGAKTIKIYVSGTPAVTMREVVRVTIPGTYLTGGANRQFVSPTEEESFETWQKSQTE
jgi:hypothetical protein